MWNRARAVTDTGRVREHNEDSHVCDADLGLALVADGMGGHAFGEVASETAAREVRRRIAGRAEVMRAFRDGGPDADPAAVRELVRSSVRGACRAVWERAQAEPEKRGMGTTCSVLVAAGERAFVGHVGDSRVYLVRDGRAVQLTRDHTLLAEMLQSGEFPAAARAAASGFAGALVRSVGVCPDVEVDVLDVETVAGDVLVLCSDGLTRHVTDAEIASIAAGDGAAERLVALANERGGLDNVTVVTIETSAAAAHDARRAELAAKTEAFRRIPLFRHLGDAQLIRVLAATRAKAFAAGDVVLTEGEPADAMYVVLSGAVRIEKSGVAVAALEPGAHFGELALLDGAPRSATAVMTSAGRLLRLRRDALDEVTDQDPGIAVSILRTFAATLAARLRTTTEELSTLRASAAAVR